MRTPMRKSSTTVDAHSSLKGERVAFTGRLASMSRRDAERLVNECGGVVSASVSAATTLLVVGMDGWPLLADGRLSNKLQKAEQLRTRSKRRLRICSEQQFLERTGVNPQPMLADKPLDAKQVSELVGVAPEILRRWELLGLVRSTDGRFDFRDLVSLQTIASLVGQGASARTIAQSVRALSRLVPGTDRPLAQLKLLADQDSLVAEVNGSLVAPEGQLLMRFHPDSEEDIEAPAPLTLPVESAHSRQYTAEEWFTIGSDHEDAGELAQAEKAYREALALQPQSAEINFNLANVLRAMNRRDVAEERYRVAIEHDPHMALAWFNLGDLLDELGRTDEAIVCFQRCVHHDRTFADAHYNLAVCHEKLGQHHEAQRNWREYVRLDPSSEWGHFARARITG